MIEVGGRSPFLADLFVLDIDTILFATITLPATTLINAFVSEREWYRGFHPLGIEEFYRC